MENASDDFPQQKKLENLLPNFAGSSPPISPKTSPTSLWKSLVLITQSILVTAREREYWFLQQSSHVLAAIFFGGQ